MFTVQCGCEAPYELHSTEEIKVKKDAGMLSIDVFAQFQTIGIGKSLSDYEVSRW